MRALPVKIKRSDIARRPALRYIVAASVLLASAPALATDGLFCDGDAYSLGMSVGSDNTVDSATLLDKSTKITTTYRLNASQRLAEIENKQLTWIASEGDFSVNRLAIVLKGKDGESFIVEAKGRQGVLRHQQGTHKLDCDWER